MTHSEQINEIAPALVKAQAAMKPAIKDATNPVYRSGYATLAALSESCRKALTDNGIAVLQDVALVESGVAVTTRLQHVSGQWYEFGPLAVPMSKPDAHGMGSATTYGKKYGLAAAVWIVTEDDEDDDGNAAVTGGSGQAKGASLPPGAQEITRIKVLGIVQRPAGNGTKYIISGSDHQTYSTLKKAIAESAKSAQEAGQEIEVRWKLTQWGRDIVEVKEALEPVL